MLRVAPLDDFEALDQAVDTHRNTDWIVFTTVNGVEGFMHRLFDRGRDARALAGPLLCAAGVGTSARLARFGIRVDVWPRVKAWTRRRRAGRPRRRSADRAC